MTELQRRRVEFVVGTARASGYRATVTHEARDRREGTRVRIEGPSKYGTAFGSYEEWGVAPNGMVAFVGMSQTASSREMRRDLGLLLRLAKEY